jgi:hypothetical protein
VTDTRHVCNICREILDERTNFLGQLLRYEHTGGPARKWDHEPVPVPFDQTEARTFCDFCYAPAPEWIVPARDFITETLPGMDPYGSKGNWGACETCALFVANGRWGALETRVFRSWERRRGPLNDGVREAMRRIWAGLREHLAGEPYKDV